MNKQWKKLLTAVALGAIVGVQPLNVVDTIVFAQEEVQASEAEQSALARLAEYYNQILEAYRVHGNQGAAKYRELIPTIQVALVDVETEEGKTNAVEIILEMRQLVLVDRSPVTIRQEERREVVPFTTEEIMDNTLPIGEQVEDVKGVDGETVTTLVVTYAGEEKVAEAVKKVSTTDAVKRIVRIGTKEAPKVEHKEEVTEESIPFQKVERENATLPKGERKVVQPGKNGVARITWVVKYTDGVETERNETSREVVTPAMDEITEIGTKEAMSSAPQSESEESASTEANESKQSESKPMSSESQSESKSMMSESQSESKSMMSESSASSNKEIKTEKQTSIESASSQAKTEDKTKQLPQTGERTHVVVFLAAITLGLSSLMMTTRKKAE
ncbi:G5 domain-containing protein [Aerococcaceae bacterium NML160702]|nr:G5 domain-containing protein [Aerococcaceae bacterium NML160702]